MNPGYYSGSGSTSNTYGTAAPAPSSGQHQQQQYAPQQQQPALSAAYAAYPQAAYSSQHPAAYQQQHYTSYQQQHHHQHYAPPATASVAAAAAGIAGYTHPAAPAAAAAAYGAHAHHLPHQSQQQQHPQQQQAYPQQPHQQDQHQQPAALTLPLLATPQQPIPAAPGQTLGAYAYPGAATPAPAPAPTSAAAAGPAVAGVMAGGARATVTPQQVAQEAIAKTMAAMQEQQLQQLQPGQVLDNRRGYLHGNLIGQMEKARLERAASKNEDYVRRKDEIARRKRLGLPLDGLIDKSTLQKVAAGGGVGAGKAHPRHQSTGVGGQSRAGIGTPAAKGQHSSVYITGLPPDVTQAKIELVFSQHGSVKRAKLYRNDAGDIKGDGLVTYAKPASVDLAIAKLNGHEITAGHPITVSMADFNRSKGDAVQETPPPPPQEQPPPPLHSNGGGNDDESGAALEGVAAAAADGDYGALPPLPVECAADKHPVVVLRSVYTREEAEADPNFFDDLEADMLMECVKFGTVISVATPEVPGYYGSVVVTFDTSSGANKCAEAMHGRWFDQRQIEALVAGKEVLDKDREEEEEEEDKEKRNGLENKRQQGERRDAAKESTDRGAREGDEDEDDHGDVDMGPLLRGAPDESPPPEDLNSFLKSI